MVFLPNLPNQFSPLKPKAKTYLPHSPLYSKITHLAIVIVISHDRLQKHKCVFPLILPLFSPTLTHCRSVQSDLEDLENDPDSLLSVVFLIINKFLQIISFFPKNCWPGYPVIKLPNADPKSEKRIVSPLCTSMQLVPECSRARENRDWLPKVWRRGAPKLCRRHLSLLLASEFSYGWTDLSTVSWWWNAVKAVGRKLPSPPHPWLAHLHHSPHTPISPLPPFHPTAPQPFPHKHICAPFSAALFSLSHSGPWLLFSGDMLKYSTWVGS